MDVFVPSEEDQCEYLKTPSYLELFISMYHLFSRAPQKLQCSPLF